MGIEAKTLVLPLRWCQRGDDFYLYAGSLIVGEVWRQDGMGGRWRVRGYNLCEHHVWGSFADSDAAKAALEQVVLAVGQQIESVKPVE